MWGNALKIETSRCLAGLGTQIKGSRVTQHGLHLGNWSEDTHFRADGVCWEDGRTWKKLGINNIGSHPIPVSMVRKQSSPTSRRSRVVGLSKEVVWTINHYLPPQLTLSVPLQFPKDKSPQTLSFYPAISLALVCPLPTELNHNSDLVTVDYRAVSPFPSTL